MIIQSLTVKFHYIMFSYDYLLVCEISMVKTIASKAKKTHGFNSCIVISVYPLDIQSIKKYTEYKYN